MKRCIFHYTGKIEDMPKVGSAVRPKKMLEAFRQIGYIVDEVTGDGKERKEKIKKIKNNINKGIKYDFLYSENRNIPTLLAEENHLPIHPLLDFGFFNYCHSRGIKIGLFYRDIYWKFDLFKDGVELHKRIVLVPMFKYDLYQYSKKVDILYVPTNLLSKYLPKKFDVRELPPGGDIHSDILERKKNKTYHNRDLRVFYVGGIAGLYDMRTLFRAIQKNKNVRLIVCTPRDQWESTKEHYQVFLCDRIQVIHKSNSELEKYYDWADVVSVCFEKNKYAELATPIKAYEAISFGTPIIASENTAIARMIKQFNIGWVIDFSLKEMYEIFEYLKDNPHEIKEKTTNTIDIAQNNTWQKRAEKVAKELTK